jgi:diguanylate cyclase (GGDEF)-like protein
VLQEGGRSSLTCPLQVEGKGIGFLFFSSASKHTYQKLHQEVFVYLARIVSSIIEKAQLYRQVHELNMQLEDALARLREQSCRDALTETLNRGAIMAFFEQQMQLAGRNKVPLCLLMLMLMLMLDHFKQINDSHGHPAGDKVLQQLVQVLSGQLRDSDRLGRYGGEEFMLILAQTELEQGVKVAERLRRAVAAMDLRCSDSLVPLSISIGVSGVTPGSTIPCAALLEQADQALYHAKRTRRNRVCLHGEGEKES